MSNKHPEPDPDRTLVYEDDEAQNELELALIDGFVENFDVIYHYHGFQRIFIDTGSGPKVQHHENELIQVHEDSGTITLPATVPQTPAVGGQSVASPALYQNGPNRALGFTMPPTLELINPHAAAAGTQSSVVQSGPSQLPQSQPGTTGPLTPSQVYLQILSDQRLAGIPFASYLRQEVHMSSPSGQWAQDLAIRDQVVRIPHIDPLQDTSLIIVIADSEVIVHQLLLQAMNNEDAILDGADSANVRFVRNTPNATKVAACKKILTELVHRCIAGYKGLAKEYATYEDMDLNASSRVDRVCETLRLAKTACHDVLSCDQKVKLLVHQPVTFGKAKKWRKDRNDRRANDGSPNGDMAQGQNQAQAGQQAKDSRSHRAE